VTTGPIDPHPPNILSEAGTSDPRGPSVVAKVASRPTPLRTGTTHGDSFVAGGPADRSAGRVGPSRSNSREEDRPEHHPLPLRVSLEPGDRAMMVRQSPWAQTPPRGLLFIEQRAVWSAHVGRPPRTRVLLVKAGSRFSGDAPASSVQTDALDCSSLGRHGDQMPALRVVARAGRRDLHCNRSAGRRVRRPRRGNERQPQVCKSGVPEQSRLRHPKTAPDGGDWRGGRSVERSEPQDVGGPALGTALTFTSPSRRPRVGADVSSVIDTKARRRSW